MSHPALRYELGGEVTQVTFMAKNTYSNYFKLDQFLSSTYSSAAQKASRFFSHTNE